MIQRVLVGSDFSEISEAALQWGVAIARAHRCAGRGGARAPGAELRHAVRAGAAGDRPRARAEGVRTPRRGRRGRRRRSQGQYRDPSRRSRVGASRRRDRGRGRPGGGRTRGQSRLEHLLLGSVAERVLSIAPVPVLLVHREDFDRHRPFTGCCSPPTSRGRRGDRPRSRSTSSARAARVADPGARLPHTGRVRCLWHLAPQLELLEEASTPPEQLQKWATELSASG